MKIHLLFPLILITLFSQLAHAGSQDQDEQSIKIEINPDITFQTVHNFGASDAWSCQHVGNWPEEKKNRIADLLFSTEIKTDGSPVGIGLSSWRFNIGAGSADQTTETKIGDPWRATSCFLQEDGSYDWDKQAGQIWFLKAAQEREVPCLMGFVNSPPVWMTKNGRANSDRGHSVNLKKEDFERFSDFLVKVTSHLQKSEGIPLDYISPVNEPQWDWKGGQEGSPWKNSEIASFCRILGSDLQKAGLKTQISITDAGKLTHLFDRGNDPKRGFQIRQFFDPDSKNYVGDVPNMAYKISGHSYFTVKNDSIMKLIRSILNEERMRIDPRLEFWMSEYCILEGNGVFKGGGRDLGMGTALFVGNIIHHDLTVANASAWQWWLAVSPYDFKDGLVYIDKSETDGNIYESKLLWSLGNYSRFIRPGAKRIAVSSRNPEGCKISAFKNSDGRVVVVVINETPINHKLNLDLRNHSFGQVVWYETSNDSDLKYMGKFMPSESIEIQARSINTFVLEYQNQ